MDFPDFPHLLQLQKDLWRWPSARAAVMVGAGFSLNSTPSPGASIHFPTWRQLSRSMFDEIHPRLPNEAEEQREERFAHSNALRLASEYEAAFGRSKLESLIRSKIPDSDHQPGDMHRLLLQLPWKDVFTTNYDTLLERTEVPGRAYQAVATVNDLTSAFSPRIIKLHGSFLSRTRFIITEEDYRTYPKCFAPFVNTVRQSLIENAFVLIGFSGDDPNFLEWTGWIRDELGGHHAPIYLVGPLSLGNVQRSLLARRGVTPIDLTPVFSGISSPNGIHTAALEWFLRSLLTVKPQRPERWSEVENRAQIPSNFEPPILGSDSAEPEEIDPFISSHDTPDEATVIKVIKRWRFERKRYPGWLVPTDETRSSLWLRTKSWMTPLITFVEKSSPADRILLFREINWRLEASMVPLFPEWMAPFEVAVNELFPSLKDGIPTKLPVKAMRAINISDTEIREAWLQIAFALLREARETYNSERWNTLKEKIGEVVVNSPQFADRYNYEQALWMVWNIERNQAKDTLARWSPSPQSPLAMMWKAGLLAELDELNEARSLLRTALREIRKSLHNTQGRNIDLLSLEGWCTYLLFSVETVVDLTRWSEIREEFSERWQELKAWDCNPWPLKRYFEEVLSEDPPVPKKEKQIIHGFDPGHSSVTHHLGGNDIGSWLPAFACIRLYEQAGIPMRLPHFNISGDALRNACKWIAPFIGFWSPAILIRAGKVKELTEHGFMDRSQVAVMEPEIAKRLYAWALEALKRELATLHGSIVMGSAQEAILEILPEVLSRLAFKVEAGELQETFPLALQFHRQPGVQAHIRLNKSCEPWFRRLFAAADGQQLLEWLPELLRFPLCEEEPQSLPPELNFWPDPINYIPVQRLHSTEKADPELMIAINEAVEWLLERAKSESGESRLRAILRLVFIFDAGLMNKNQRKNLGMLLWSKTNEYGLPDLQDIHDFGYLDLPAPSDINVSARIKDYILTFISKSTSEDPQTNTTAIGGSLENLMLLNMAMASKAIVQLTEEPRGTVEWTWKETMDLWDKAMGWWRRGKRVLALERQAPFPAESDRVLLGLERLGVFLQRAVLPQMDSASEADWNKISPFLSESRKEGFYLTAAFPYILLHRANNKDLVIETIHRDLLSKNERAVGASAKAVRHWIHLASSNLLDNPPSSVLDELIQRVVFRRPEGIQTCINQMALLLIEKPDAFTSSQVNLMVSSLTPWHYATHLPLSEEREGDFPEEERPELRTLLGRLASALSIWLKKKFPDQPEPPEISDLRKLYKSDSLPEVRRAFDTWKSLKTDSSD